MTEHSFAARHIGPSPDDVAAMLKTVGHGTVEELMAAAIPDSRMVLVGGGHFIDPGEPEVLRFIGEVLGR